MPAKAPQTYEPCAIVARVALEAMSRRLLTEAIEMCDNVASRLQRDLSLPVQAHRDWRVASDAFRAERRRRY